MLNIQELEMLLDRLGFVRKNAVSNNFQGIESLLNFQLPEDYKYYLNNYEDFEGSFDTDYLILFGYNDVLELNKIADTDDLLSNTLLIGSNGASESIGIRNINPETHQVVIAQYIYNIDDQIEIGGSFTDMLRRLDGGIEWFS